MRTDFGSLFDDHDRKIRVELQQPARGGKTRRPATDDHDIKLHGFAFVRFRHVPKLLF